MEQLGIFERTGRILEGLEEFVSSDALPNFLLFAAGAWVWISVDADWLVSLGVMVFALFALALLLAYVGPVLAIGLFVIAFAAAVLIEGWILVRRLAPAVARILHATAARNALRPAALRKSRQSAPPARPASASRPRAAFPGRQWSSGALPPWAGLHCPSACQTGLPPAA